MTIERSGRVRVASVDEVVEDRGTVVMVNGRAVALFRVGEDVYAIDNTCPHRGGPLGEGDVSGPVVMCPWHAWEVDVRTGALVRNASVRVPCFAVAVEDGAVYVDLSTPAGG
jgi:NAD(P)H-dependent nitrite reductase small subunit